MKHSLKRWTGPLLTMGLFGFAVAIAFKETDSSLIICLIYVSTAVFLVSVALMLVIISRWTPFQRH